MGARAGKYKLGARTRAGGQAKGRANQEIQIPGINRYKRENYKHDFLLFLFLKVCTSYVVVVYPILLVGHIFVSRWEIPFTSPFFIVLN